MIGFVSSYAQILLSTLRDVLPIAALIAFFQFVVLRQPIPHPKKVVAGAVLVVLGLSLFLLGLDMALFPLGNLMATQLSDPDFLGLAPGQQGHWSAYYWIYSFAAAIGFATALAEPSLIAVAYKASEVSAGAISQWGLRVTVAFGVALALALGAFRIITGTPLYWYILGGYVIVLIQTIFAPRQIIPLAYDSGGVATSTVTVPIVAALGLGLSAAVPGRNPAIDGFGMIALACLLPIISVLGYAKLTELRNHYQKNR